MYCQKITSSALAGYLEALISDHDQMFTRCYPGASKIPKLHYTAHFPQQIIRQKMHALLVMRMEAKNSFLKQEWDRGAIFKEEWTPTEIIRTIFST